MGYRRVVLLTLLVLLEGVASKTVCERGARILSWRWTLGLDRLGADVWHHNFLIDEFFGRLLFLDLLRGSVGRAAWSVRRRLCYRLVAF